MKEIKLKILNKLDEKFINHNGLNKLAKVLSNILNFGFEDILLALKELEKEGEIFEFSKNKFASSKQLGLVKGKVSYSNKNYSFVLNEEGDIFVLKKNLLNAFDGDFVLVKIISKSIGDKKREGKVLKIISRNTSSIVGTFNKIKKYGYVIVDKSKFDKDIYIGEKDTKDAKDGDKVVVKITSIKSGNPVGIIEEVIGDPTKPWNDVKCILRQYHIIEDFSQAVKDEIKGIAQKIDKEKYKNRKDLTDLMLFTIDGKDAKDLDDAVSLSKNDDGTYLLGVHIADVGEYVKLDSEIDKNAFERGTSVYFLDKVIPMLPRELSNGICSLNEGVDRLALSVFMKIDSTGAVVNSEICESIINSKHRLNYDEVLEVVEGRVETQNRLSDISDNLLLMFELSQILSKRRRDFGSLDFDLPESKILLDENGKPIKIEKRIATKSTKIIETFMVVANETIAKKFCESKIPFVYRVHEKPDADKMNSFINFMSSLGVKVESNKKDIEPIDLQKVLNSVEGKDICQVVNMIMLRSLKKAKYFDSCLGHFGLALNFYCHFTSPIRRYPDLVIHRIIKEFLRGNKSFITSPKMISFVEKASIKSSEMEKNSEDVERAIEDYKKCEYMSGLIGQEFEGIISGMNVKGFFVELEDTCEGFVSISTLKNDFYNFNESTWTLEGKNHFFKLGEKVRVKLESCILNERKINFEFINKV